MQAPGAAASVWSWPGRPGGGEHRVGAHDEVKHVSQPVRSVDTPPPPGLDTHPQAGGGGFKGADRRLGGVMRPHAECLPAQPQPGTNPSLRWHPARACTDGSRMAGPVDAHRACRGYPPGGRWPAAWRASVTYAAQSSGRPVARQRAMATMSRAECSRRAFIAGVPSLHRPAFASRSMTDPAGGSSRRGAGGGGAGARRTSHRPPSRIHASTDSRVMSRHQCKDV